MKKLIILGLIISTVAFSATKDNLNRFEAGDAASASDVMENFDDLADAIDTNTTAIASKAETSDLADKADKSYVDTQLTSKADVSDLAAKASVGYVDSEIANISTVSIQTTLWQKKTLNRNITSNETNISELRFDNLTVGKVYRLTMSAYLLVYESEWLRFEAVHDGQNICYVMLGNSNINWSYNIGGNSIVFKATGSSLKFNLQYNAAGVKSYVAGSEGNSTFVVLEELPYHSSTTKF